MFKVSGTATGAWKASTAIATIASVGTVTATRAGLPATRCTGSAVSNLM